MVGGTRSGPVLISGCSSGIGRAAAISLHAAGLTVYATARQVDALAGAWPGRASTRWRST